MDREYNPEPCNGLDSPKYYIPPSLNCFRPRIHNTSSPYCIYIAWSRKTTMSFVEGKDEWACKYNENIWLGRDPANLVKSFTTELPRPITTVHIAPKLHNNEYIE